MKTIRGKRPGTVTKWFMNHLIQPVPAGIALCEYDCRKSGCSPEEWRNCKRRLESLKRDS